MAQLSELSIARNMGVADGLCDVFLLVAHEAEFVELNGAGSGYDSHRCHTVTFCCVEITLHYTGIFRYKYVSEREFLYSFHKNKIHIVYTKGDFSSIFSLS